MEDVPSPDDGGQRSRLPLTLLVALPGLVLLGGLLGWALTRGPSEPGTTETSPAAGAPEEASPGRGPDWDVQRGVGEVVRLPDGGVARLNGVTPDFELDPGLPGPEPGTRLDRLDVEQCAGADPQFSDAAFWVGLGEDNAVHSAHMGVRDFLTLTLAPGSCQRGTVDVAMPEDVELAAVLLMDREREAVASWRVGADVGPVPPLNSGLEPETLDAGATADLMVGGTATLHGFGPSTEGAPAPGRTLLEVEGEVCAVQQPIEASPQDWFVQLSDHRLVRAERDVGTLQPVALDQGDCDRGTALFTVPDDAEAVAVLFASAGRFEEARWAAEAR